MEFVPIEKFLRNMVHLEQFVDDVIHCTSQYNRSNSYLYAPINIIGKYTKYPSYGDFDDAFSLRTYGKWWRTSENCQTDYRPQEFDPLDAEDFIILRFRSAVVPRDICIYEIYNPGAICRIWGKTVEGLNPWVLLWEGESEKCPEKSRKFHPPIKKINFLIQHIRLEFNQTKLTYHLSIDAVLLGGFQPFSETQDQLIRNNLICSPPECPDIIKIHEDDDRAVTIDCDIFSLLPNEVMLHIFQYLDLKSLSRCSLVSKRWNLISNDPVLYQNIALKTYWNLVDPDTLDYFLKKRSAIKKLDLSWCETNSPLMMHKVITIIKKNSSYLTHLSMCDCYLTNLEIESISSCRELIDLRLKNTRDWTLSTLHRLRNLTAIDLTATNVSDHDLIRILESNRGLKHIIIDLCENLKRLDEVINVLVQCNKDLITWSSWKTVSLTAEGVKQFSKLYSLKELDLGWCLLTTDPGDSLQHISNSCLRLKRLILCGWRGINDLLLRDVIMRCRELQQLDLLGIKNISAELCEVAFVTLPNLRLLDISYCDSIRHDQVDKWRLEYPHVTIQRSCQHIVNDYLT